MKTNDKQVEEVRTYLNELLALLEGEKEGNWSRGIRAACHELVSSEACIAEAGFENARSIFNTMMAGGRGFAEYYVWVEDEGERMRRNKALDELRRKIWEIFNS